MENISPYLTKIREEIIEKSKEERENQFLQASGEFESDLNNHLCSIFGTRYVKRFKESEVVKKTQVDNLIEQAWDEGISFILSGDVGVGKTMALIYIYKKIIEFAGRVDKEKRDGYKYRVSRYTPLIQYYFAPELFSMLHQGVKPVIRKFMFLDDLGREYAEPFALERFECFIEDIYKNGAVRVILTTNLTLNQFKMREGWARITDRLMEICSFLEIKGSSRRHK
jgi:DNA replication protein DnaC